MKYRYAQRLDPYRPLLLDWVVWAFMGALTLVAGLLVLLGDPAQARVTNFSWQERTVGAENIGFTLTFNRPMDTRSVADNLAIQPVLPGRISWAGRRMVYTLDEPIPYGETFEVSLADARDRFSAESKAVQFEEFSASFRSRDRAMVYIGTQGQEKGRLVLVNFSQGGEPVPLTPPTLTVLDFEPYPLGDRLLFSAIETTAAESGDLVPTLYTVTTGLQITPPQEALVGTSAPLSATTATAAGELTSILTNEEYQNLAFDLAPDGRTIVVQRLSRTDADEFGLWLLRENESASPLETEPGGEFLIAPDSQTLLMLQGQGTAIIPLTPEEQDTPIAAPLDFLPEFGRVFDLTKDGSMAAMVNFNQNDPEKRFTESLIEVTNQGSETELLNVTGSILDAQFDPTAQVLYVLASQLLPGAAYQEQPFLAAIDLDTQEALTLLNLPPQARTSMSVSPDGLAALVEVAVPDNEQPNVFSVQMLLLPLFRTTEERQSRTPTQVAPQVLPFSGVLPTWLP